MHKNFIQNLKWRPVSKSRWENNMKVNLEETGCVTGFCEYDIVPSSFITGLEYLDNLCDDQLLKKESVPWILFWCVWWIFDASHTYSLVLWFSRMEFSVQLRLPVMNRVECWKISNVSANTIFVILKVNMLVGGFLEVLYRAGCSSRAGYDGWMWLAERVSGLMSNWRRTRFGKEVMRNFF
jgi:hypothetical protein